MSDKRDAGKFAGMASGDALQQLANTNPLEVMVATNAAMKDGAIERLSDQFEDTAQVDEAGTEFWARTRSREAPWIF